MGEAVQIVGRFDGFGLGPPLIETRENIEDVKRWAPWPNEPVSTSLEHAKAGERLKEVEADLNDFYQQRRIEEAQRAANEAELKELEELERRAQEEEEEAWLKEAARQLSETEEDDKERKRQQDAKQREAGAGDAGNQSGSGAGVPANLDAPNGVLPELPSHLVNPAPTHIPQIIIDPIGDAGTY